MRDETGVLRVGMIDGPVDLDGIRPANVRDFSGTGDVVQDSPALSHGNGAARVITMECPDIVLYVARVFGISLVCRPEQVAQAMRWLADEQVGLINMSFGLRHDRSVLRECCRQLADRGICLVAAAPAQGEGVYPSLYPGVVRATGDARCAPGEIAWLHSEQADYGGYPGRPDHSFAGASAGCASVTGAIARLANQYPDLDVEELLQTLAKRADYRGREQRSGGESR
jgi:hypothetical protein